jgi:hypothetical protein
LERPRLQQLHLPLLRRLHGSITSNRGDGRYDVAKRVVWWGVETRDTARRA